MNQKNQNNITSVVFGSFNVLFVGMPWKVNGQYVFGVLWPVVSRTQKVATGHVPQQHFRKDVAPAHAGATFTQEKHLAGGGPTAIPYDYIILDVWHDRTV